MRRVVVVIVLVSLIVTAAIIPIILLTSKKAQLILNNFAFWGGGGTYWERSYVWASVSVKDSTDNWVTGLSLNDFKLSEELLDSTGHVIQERPITFDRTGYSCQFDGDGFWERTVTSEKLDIIFLIDMTGSMENEMAKIHSELHEFINRLEATHVDFRVAIVKYEESTVENSPAQSYTSWAFTMPFRGVMETKEIHEWLDHVQLAGGEWWVPVASYDHMMIASGFDFREEARKVLVVITDSPAQNVYGTYWYAPDCSATTLSSVELLLREKSIEVLYSQPDELRHLEGYYDPNINPKAKGSFETLGKRISWPFQQEDINLNGGKIVDSQYFFAWMSGLDIPGDPRDYTVRVTIKTMNPERSDEFMECSFSYVPCRQDAKLTISICDEAGNPIDEDVVVNFWNEMGDRREQHYPYGGVKPKNGLIVIEDMHVGKYYLTFHATGDPVYSYETLRYLKRLRVEIPAQGLNLSLQVETGDRDMELAKVKGLLEDLDKCGLPGEPFKDFVAEAKKWLAEIEANGVTWQEMVVVKRFYVALSGYANFNGYVQRAAESATEDLTVIIQNLHEIVNQAKAFKDARKASIGEKLAAAALEAAFYDVLTFGRFTAARIAVEIALDALEEYVENKLMSDLVSAVLNQIPNGPYKPIITAMVNEYIGKPQLSKDMIQKDFNENILKPYYIEKAKAGLYAALANARNYTPKGQPPDDWERGMRDDFHEYRQIVDSVQDTAWNALKTQSDIENWANRITGFKNVLDTLVTALDNIAAFYPPFKDEAKAVHGLIAALDGIQILPKAIEFGLEVDCIDTLGNKVGSLSQTAFADTYFND